MGCRPESTLRAALCAAACTLTGTECSGSLLLKAQRLSGPMGDKQRKIVGGHRCALRGLPSGVPPRIDATGGRLRGGVHADGFPRELCPDRTSRGR